MEIERLSISFYYNRDYAGSGEKEMTSKLYPYLIADTGRQINIRKVSPMLAREVATLRRKPDPPLNKVVYPDGHEEMEPNEADPRYQEQLNDYSNQMISEVQKLTIERGVFVELTDDDRREIEELRKFWLDEYNETLKGSDKYIFVAHICIGTVEDLQDLVKAITRRSSATPEGTAQTLATFQSRV